MSLPEVLLWQVLRKRPAGLKFRRQFPTDRITTDFACLSHRLIVEVDGEGHSFGEQPRRDASRDAGLLRDGFEVMRIPAFEVLRDLDAVLTYVLARCSEVGPLHHSATLSGTPPRPGEDLCAGQIHEAIYCATAGASAKEQDDRGRCLPD